VFDVKDGAFHLLEVAPGVTVEEVIAKTAGKLIISDNVKEITF
jgi:3-oxoacid CoA-transferase subunit B